MTRDARGRIMGGDFRYGRLCECGNLKGWQSSLCWSCHTDRLRDESYWARRTCECGGPKDRHSLRCERCENLRRIGRSGKGLPQPDSHPWRKLLA